MERISLFIYFSLQFRFRPFEIFIDGVGHFLMAIVCSSIACFFYIYLFIIELDRCSFEIKETKLNSAKNHKKTKRILIIIIFIIIIIKEKLIEIGGGLFFFFFFFRFYMAKLKILSTLRARTES